MSPYTLFAKLETAKRNRDYYQAQAEKAEAEIRGFENQIVDLMEACDTLTVFVADTVYHLHDGDLIVRPCTHVTDLKPAAPALIDDVELPVSPPYQCDCPSCEDDAHARMLTATVPADGETD